MKKTLISIGGFLLLALAAFAYLQYNKPHRNTAAEAPAHALQASALLQEYEADEEAANGKYLNKLLLVQGRLLHMNTASDGTPSLLLASSNPMAGISCELVPEEAEKLASYQQGDTITVKGICSGMLMDVVLVRSVIVENKP